MAELHFGSKEYFEKQSEFWFKENSKHISERDAYKKQRDELINDMAEVKRKAEAYGKIKEAADSEKLNGYLLYDNERFIDRLCHVFDEIEADHER